MKISISLDQKHLETLDQFVATSGLKSRSAGIKKAIALLDSATLAEEYAIAFKESETETNLWNVTNADGLQDETW